MISQGEFISLCNPSRGRVEVSLLPLQTGAIPSSFLHAHYLEWDPNEHYLGCLSGSLAYHNYHILHWWLVFWYHNSIELSEVARGNAVKPRDMEKIVVEKWYYFRRLHFKHFSGKNVKIQFFFEVNPLAYAGGGGGEDSPPRNRQNCSFLR